jgi:AcrR family transcriptional regulator
MTKRKPGALRERLLECTTAIIRERGLGFVSLRAVARRARVSHGAPAHHFRNKSGLLTAYAAQGYRGVEAAVRQELVGVGDDPRERLQAIGLGYVRFAIGHPEQFGIMFRTELVNGDDPELLAASDAVYVLLADRIAECVAARLLPARLTLATTVAGWSLAHGMAWLWLGGRIPARAGAVDPDRLVRDVLRLFVTSVMPADPAPPRRRRARR